MHLLALLIAAVFSSQFVSVNAGETFTSSPKKIHGTETTDVVITNTGTDWTGPVKIFVNAVGGTAPEYGDGSNWVAAADSAKVYTASVAFTGKAPDANGKLYVWIALNTDATAAVIATPAVIEVVDTWWVEEIDPLTTVSNKIENIVIRPPKTAWAFDDGQTEITLYIAKELINPFPTEVTDAKLLAKANATVVTRANAAGDYECAEIDLATLLDLGGLGKIYMYISYVAAGGSSNGVDTFDPHVEEITVASTEWTLLPNAFKDTELTKLPAITVSSDDQVLWKNNMKLRVVRAEGTDDEKVALLTITETEDPARANDPGDKTYAVAAGGNLNDLKILTGDLGTEMSLKVYLVIDDDVTHDKTVSITVTKQAPDFTLVTATLAETAIVTPVTVTITAPDSVRANDAGAGWDDSIVTAVIKKEKTKPTGAATGFFAVGTQTAPGDDFLFTIDLTTLAVTDDLKELYVFVGTVPKPVILAAGLSNDNPTWLDAPGTITFQPEAPLEGKVVLDPEEVAFADLAAPGEIKVSIVASTANTLAALGANSRFKIEYTDTTPTTKSVSGAIKAHEARSNTIDYYYIDNPKLDDIGIPDAACDAKVYIYPTGTRNAIETVLGITSDTPPPEEPEFVLDPAYVLFADVASLPVIEVKPDIEVSWPTSGMKLTFSYEAPAANAAITYDIAVTKVDTKYVTAAEASLATLLIEEEDLPADVTVTFHDGTKYLTHPFTFKVLGKEPPPQVTFTIEPNEIDYADALKTQEIVITPAADHGWPTSGTDMKFRISNPDASPAPNPVTGAVTIAAGATAETKKYSIPEETAISGLFAAAPTANVVLKIEVTPDGVTWLNHKADYTVKVAGKPEAAMGVSPLLSLLAALVFLFVKLF